MKIYQTYINLRAKKKDITKIFNNILLRNAGTSKLLNPPNPSSELIY